MKRRKYYPEVLALAAVVTVALAGIGKAWSYFTTYAEAAGGYTIHLGDRTEITESFSGWTKHVVIANEENSEPVYIRVKAFCGSQYKILYSGEGWTEGSGGYYYYNEMVKGNSAAEPLDLKIEEIPDDPEDRENFNVVVIYESAPVKYHEDGSAYTPEETDWGELLDTGTTESSGGDDLSGDTEASQDAEDSTESGTGAGTDAAGTEGGAEG